MNNLKKLISVSLSSLTILTLGFSSINAMNNDYQRGVTVTENNESQYAGDFNLEFVYEDIDTRDAVKVEVIGNFQWFSNDDPVVQNYVTECTKGEKGSIASLNGLTAYDAWNYSDGMYTSTAVTKAYEMTEVENEIFTLTIPVPGNLYYYDYKVTYDDGSIVTMQDPANPSPVNEKNGHSAGHSIIYVGDKNNTTISQNYIYARNDNKIGTVTYVPYTSNKNTTEYVGVYLPKGYDKSKTYKTIYVSHGGMGNEVEWMTIGALPNIMDNLIAENEIYENTIVVTMDNSAWMPENFDTSVKYQFGENLMPSYGVLWDGEAACDNLINNIIPMIEKNYSVSHETKDRAMCGLSWGAYTTSYMMWYHTDLMKYYGIFSNGIYASTNEPKSFKDKVIYITAGNLDSALNGAYKLADHLKNFKNNYNVDFDVNYNIDYQYGSHCWQTWRSAFTTFAKDYLWDIDNNTQNNEENISSSINDNGGSNQKTKSVKTGDTSDSIIYVALSSIALLIYFVIKNRHCTN